MRIALGVTAVWKGAPTHRLRISHSAPARPTRYAGSIFLLLFLFLPWPVREYALGTSSDFDDLAFRAAAARDQHNIPLAIDLYGQAEQLKPDWAEGWFYLGLLEYSSNGYKAASDAFNHFLQLKPGAAPALALRGLCEFETSDFDNALRDLEESVRNGAADDPHNEQIIRYHFAQLLTRAGRFEDAVAQYRFFVAHRIEDPDLLVGLGLAAMRIQAMSGNVPPANREFLQAVGTAGYTFLSGDSEGASQRFDQLFALYPKVPELYSFYGNLLFQHSPEQAIQQFRSAVALAPDNANARAMLAYLLMVAGHYAEARPEAEQALAAAPDMELAQIALGRSLAETGEEKRAAELLNQVLKKDPESLEAHMGLAAMYARSGKREDAYRERMFCLGQSQ